MMGWVYVWELMILLPTKNKDTIKGFCFLFGGKGFFFIIILASLLAHLKVWLYHGMLVSSFIISSLKINGRGNKDFATIGALFGFHSSQTPTPTPPFLSHCQFTYISHHTLSQCQTYYFTIQIQRKLIFIGPFCRGLMFENIYIFWEKKNQMN